MQELNDKKEILFNKSNNFEANRTNITNTARLTRIMQKGTIQQSKITSKIP